MWIFQIALISLILFAAIKFGVIPPPYVKVLLRVNSGVLNVTKGDIESQTKMFVSDILREANVYEGFIAIRRNNRVQFSWDIPSELHQRLRNVLIN